MNGFHVRSNVGFVEELEAQFSEGSHLLLLRDEEELHSVGSRVEVEDTLPGLTVSVSPELLRWS
jgi:hypothetical protein